MDVLFFKPALCCQQQLWQSGIR